MNLLIKALEHSARERTSKPLEDNAHLKLQKTSELREPTLEPASTPRLHLELEESRTGIPADSTQTRSSGVRESLRVEDAGVSGSRARVRSISSDRDTRAVAVTPGPARLQIGAAGRAFAFRRANRLAALGGVAGSLAIAFGAYVYTQVAAPGILVQQTAPQGQHAPRPDVPVAVTTEASARDAAATETVTSAGPARDPKIAPLPIAAGAPATEASSGPGHGNMPASNHAEAGTPAQDNKRTAAAPIPTSAIIATRRPTERTPTSSARETAAEQGGSHSTDAALKPDTPVQAGNAVSGNGREHITVSLGTGAARLNPHVTQGYALLQSGRLEEAHTLYKRAVEAEPLNLDALLGLASIAALEQRTDDAMKAYLRVLLVNPRHGIAQAALIGLIGRADPIAAESRLKHLLSREPSAFLHFVLGNIYADQSSWSQAQHAYFQAHHLEPDNPDYAYNAAVGLDHLRQRKHALEFYRRAEQLATHRGRSNFDLAHARDRIGSLASQALE